MVPWSSGMIPPLQGGDHEFESRRNHFPTIFKNLTIISRIFYHFLTTFSKIFEQNIKNIQIN